MPFVTEVLQVDELAGVPGVLADGMIWYNNVANTHQARQNGATVDFPGTAGLWTKAGNAVYPTTFATDVVAIGVNAMSGSEHLYVKDDTEGGSTAGVLVELEKNLAGDKTSWAGVEVEATFSAGGGCSGDLTLFNADFNLNTAAGPQVLVDIRGLNIDLSIGGFTSVTLATGVYIGEVSQGGVLTSATGVFVDALKGESAYGLYVSNLESTNLAYGVYIEAQNNGTGLFCDDDAQITGMLTLDGVLYNTDGVAFAERADHPLTPADGWGQVWVQTGAPCTLWYTDDAGTDVQLGTGGGASPWSEAASILYPTTHATDDVVIGLNTMSGTERLRVTNRTITATSTTMLIDPVVTNGTPGVLVGLDVFFTASGGTVTAASDIRIFSPTMSGGAITTHYGLEIASLGGSGSVTNCYGVYVSSQNGTGSNYGFYAAGNTDMNAFLGTLVVGAAAPATSAGIELSSTTKAVLVSRMTVTQRNALTAVDGMIIYTTDQGQFEFREDGAWVTGTGLK